MENSIGVVAVRSRPSTAGRKIQRWEQSEIARLHQMYNRGMTREAMAKELNMPEDRIRSRLQWESQSGTLLEARKRRRAAQRLVTKHEQRSERMFFDKVSAGPQPTEEALRRREAMYAAPHRDLTGAFFGDPPVGFSALEGRP